MRYNAESEQGGRALQPLAGGFYAIVWAIIGDLDYMNKTLLLPRSTLASGPCCLCRCVGSGPLTWMDFRPTAPWRGVLWKAYHWRLWPGRSPSPLFELLPHFSPWLISHDWLHCKYLGHDQLVYGSVLSLLVRHVLPGNNAQANLAQIWRDIQWHYSQYPVPVRFKYLNKLSMFERKHPAYPKLRGKGAEVKYLCGPLLYCWQKYHSEHLQVHRQILLYLQLNNEIEETLIVYRLETALPPAEADKFEHTVTTMLLLLSSIAEHFLAERLFNITQKAHFLQHLSLLSRFVSPRLTWCFQGEDMQKRMSCLAKTCVNGQRAGQTIGKMLARYRLALHLELSEKQDS